MQRVTLEIRTQPARIGIETKKARAPVHHGLAPFYLDKTEAELNITTRKPELSIDASAAWAELGLASYQELGRRLRDQYVRDFLAGVERVAQEGDRLAAFWVPGNTIADLAAEAPPPAELNIWAAPAHPVQVSVEPGDVDYNFQPGGVSASLGPKPPPSPYEPGAIRVYLRQLPAIFIDVRW